MRLETVLPGGGARSMWMSCRGGTLNEDVLPGQADEIVGSLRLELMLSL